MSPRKLITSPRARKGTSLLLGDGFIDTQKAAMITGYTQEHICRLCRNGKVEAAKIGYRWVVKETSLTEYQKSYN